MLTKQVFIHRSAVTCTSPHINSAFDTNWTLMYQCSVSWKKLNKKVHFLSRIFSEKYIAMVFKMKYRNRNRLLLVYRTRNDQRFLILKAYWIKWSKSSGVIHVSVDTKCHVKVCEAVFVLKNNNQTTSTHSQLAHDRFTMRVKKY